MKRHPLLVMVAVAALSTLAVALLHRFGGPAGLTVTVSLPGEPTRPPIFTGTDDLLTRQSSEALAMRAGGAAALLHWDGFLWVEEAREYEIRAASDAPARLWIDSRLVFEGTGSRDTKPARVRLTARQHLVAIDYGPTTRSTRFQLEWDVGNAYRLSPIPRTVLSPRPLSASEWRVHALVPRIAVVVALIWFGVLCWAATIPVRRAARSQLTWTWPLAGAFAGAAILFTAGIWWGGAAGWAPDEVDPAGVVEAVQRRFANGWYTIYPPLQYYVIALAAGPIFMADALGWLSVHSDTVYQVMMLESRVISVVMGLSTLVALALLATRAFGERYAWPAVLACAAFLPFPFYAKTANVEMAYVCWFAWSLVFLANLYGHGRVRDAILLGITAAASVGTKDQAYGLYVLPALLLLWRFGRSRSGWPVLAAGALASAATLLLVLNVAGNYPGIASHIGLILGPGSEGFRIFPPTPAGHSALFAATLVQLFTAVGTAGSALILLSLASPAYRRGRTAMMLALVSAVSYYVTFIAVIGYVYDRFLMPITTILALFAAVGVRRLLDSEKSRTAGRVVAAVLLVWVVARAASIDALMIRDSRVYAERWLREHVEKDEIVSAANQYVYLPRLAAFRFEWIQPSISSTLAVSPEYVVLSREHADRYPADSEARKWVEWLQSEAGLYQEVLRYKASIGWSTLRWDRRFNDGMEDMFTNLDKVNPEIVIFRKRH